MAAPTEIYVDPSIAGDSGAGTVGDPYGDLEWAIEQATFDTTNGNRVNVKNGTDETLAAVINTAMADTGTSIAWAPTATAPLIFQGYTSAAGDGGVGGISGGGSIAIFTADNFIHFRDMHTHNCGSAAILTLDSKCSIVGCEVDNTSGSGIVMDTGNSTCGGNYIHNVGGFGIKHNTGAVWDNYLANGSNDFSEAIQVRGNCAVTGNIISIDGASKGIRLIADGNLVQFNSVLSAGGTGTGIESDTESAIVISNNLVEGFSTSAGKGIDLSSSSEVQYAFNNAAFNNVTDYANASDGDSDWPAARDNESLGATPFAKSGSDTFANRFTYFAPVDTGNVQGGAYPSGARRDKGAVQHVDPAGGAGVIKSAGNGGGMVG